MGHPLNKIKQTEIFSTHDISELNYYQNKIQKLIYM